MGNKAATHDEFLEHIRQALVRAGGPDHIVRWDALLSESGGVGSLPSRIARDLGVPEADVLSGILDLAAWGTIMLRPAGLSCKERGLRIQAEGDSAVRFALLPHLKPVLLPREDGWFTVALLALEYVSADPRTCGFSKLADGSLPRITWRVGYVELTPFEFWRLCRLAEGKDYQRLYGYDLVMSTCSNPRDVDIVIKNKWSQMWTRNRQVAEKVEEAAHQLARDGGAKVLEKLGKQAAFEDWATLASRTLPTPGRKEQASQNEDAINQGGCDEYFII